MYKREEKKLLNAVEKEEGSMYCPYHNCQLEYEEDDHMEFLSCPVNRDEAFRTDKPYEQIPYQPEPEPPDDED